MPRRQWTLPPNNNNCIIATHSSCRQSRHCIVFVLISTVFAMSTTRALARSGRLFVLSCTSLRPPQTARPAFPCIHGSLTRQQRQFAKTTRPCQTHETSGIEPNEPQHDSSTTLPNNNSRSIAIMNLTHRVSKRAVKEWLQSGGFEMCVHLSDI